MRGKPHIERTFGSVASLFCEFMSGYAGRNADRRGRGTGDEPLWSMLELQELLDEWLIAAWQNRPHDELRDPAHPGRAFTPNEKYAAMIEAAGYVPVALSGDDYVELLPAEWRAVNAYGIKIRRRTYDSEELNPLRHQPSGVREKKNLHEVRHDPYDVSRVHVRGPDGWITCGWRHLHRAPMPFGELAWDHARRNLERQGRTVTEAEIADAVSGLLARAGQGPEPGTGPAGKRGRRVAARTRALTDLTCAHCGTPLTAKHKGRTARWCSPACGLRGLRRRKRGKPERGEPAAPRTACRRCGARISQKPTGRPAEWCSHACWKRDHRQQLKAAAEI
jgi:hypothetical protein